MAELEELQGNRPVTPRREVKAAERVVTLERLAHRPIDVIGSLFLAQSSRCFHCGGAMPFMGSRHQAGMASKDHALPRATRPGKQELNGAAVLAHRLCNIERDERAFTRNDWTRAEELWTRAARISATAPSVAQLFRHWAELARHMAKESGQ